MLHFHFSFLSLDSLYESLWIRLTQGCYLHANTEQTQRDMHALSGIRTHDPSVCVGKDILYLKPRGQCDWHLVIYSILITALKILPWFDCSDEGYMNCDSILLCSMQLQFCMLLPYLNIFIMF
jgi:hypothetical protein